MEKENRLTFIDEDGNEILCEILFTFESKEFNKNYVLFYPVDGGDEEDVEVMAASYLPSEDGEGDLQAIETEEEWDMIEKVLDQFEEEHDHEGCGCGDGECEDGECEDGDCECEHDHDHGHHHHHHDEEEKDEE
jgi:uncharacterized protein YrzB (UPF0473 family)